MTMDLSLLTSIITILILAPIIASEEVCRSSCGALRSISSPFRLTTDPSTCGDSQYQLTCDQNRPVLELYSAKYSVEEISYEDQVARVVLFDLDSTAGCFPRSLPFLTPTKFNKYGEPFTLETNNSITFVSCPSPVANRSYIPISSCVGDSSSSSKGYLYALTGRMTVADLQKRCGTTGTVPAVDMLQNRTEAAIRDALMKGFNISWKIPLLCSDCVAERLKCSNYTGYQPEFFSFSYRKGKKGHCYGSCRPLQSASCECPLNLPPYVLSPKENSSIDPI